MKTIELIEQAGQDKVLRMSVPVDEALGRYRVIMLIEAEEKSRGKELDQWPPGFFERTAGAWVGELERLPQGEYEKREAL